MPPDKLTAKRRLFISLDRLTEDDEQSEERHHQSMLSLNMPRSPAPKTDLQRDRLSRDVRETQSSAKLLSSSPPKGVAHSNIRQTKPKRSNDIWYSKKPVPTNTIIHSNGTKGTAVAEEAPTDTEVVKDTPIRAIVAPREAEIQEKQSDRPNPSRSSYRKQPALSKAGSKRKRNDEIKQIPEDQKMLKGLNFCELRRQFSFSSSEESLADNCQTVYFPNNDLAPARRRRMNKAIEYGANVIREWNLEIITHIIFDLSTPYGELFRCLGVSAIPVRLASFRLIGMVTNS